MFRHPRVHFFRKSDEARVESMLSRFPRKIMRIERDAVSADARSGIKRHEPKGFCGRCTNHFPRVDTERVAEARHLVGHADVDGTKSVLEKFRCLGYTRRTDRVNLTHNLAIESGGGFG